MIKKSVKAPDTEPNQFEKPSEGEHTFQVVDIFDVPDNPDVVFVKCEVVGGEEEGRSLLNRLSLDPEWKGFFATRLFLKSIAQPYKGDIEIDTDEWPGKQFVATVEHNDGYANIKEYNFDKMIEEVDTKPDKAKPADSEVAWDD